MVPLSKSGLKYIATPYSHPDPAVRIQRFKVVTVIAARLRRRGYHVFSPITQGHVMASAAKLPLDWDYWQEDARLALAACNGLIIVTQRGWQESVGVQAEIEIAREMGMPIFKVQPIIPAPSIPKPIAA